MTARLRVGPDLVRSCCWASFCVAVTLLKLWLVSAQTLSAFAPSPHDDQLFLSHAISLLHGEWLGPLSDLTLAKGPVYPLWLALNQLAGLRLILSQAVLYVLACAGLVWAIRPLVGDAWRLALLYLVALFNPASWADGPSTHVLREGIYPALSLLLLGSAIGTALRVRGALRAAVPWAIAAGFVGALFVMTREEGVWLAPSLGIVAMVGLAGNGRSSWRAWLSVTGAVAIAYLVPTTAIAAMNWRRYGQYETCETRAAYYKAAYGALTRVKSATWNRYVPVSLEARAKVFAVSPAFREVAPHLERSATAWISHGCKALGVCDDLAGGWFMWAFRAAVTSAGEYRDGQTAQNWYERLALEVDRACTSGALDCLPRRSTWMPPWRAEYLPPLASAIGRASLFATTFTDVTPFATLPLGDESQLTEFEEVTNERLPRQIRELQGVMTSSEGEVNAMVVDHLGNVIPANIQRSATAPVMAASEGGRRSTRFAVSARCAADCALVLVTRDGHPLIVSLSDRPEIRGDPGLTWSTERVALRLVDGPDKGWRARLLVLEALTRAYALAMPPLAVLAMLLLAWRLAGAARERAWPLRSLVALAVLVGVGMRVLVLALVDATSFPAINVVYMSPAYCLLIAFVSLTLLGGADTSLTAARRVSDALHPESPRDGAKAGNGARARSRY